MTLCWVVQIDNCLLFSEYANAGYYCDFTPVGMSHEFSSETPFYDRAPTIGKLYDRVPDKRFCFPEEGEREVFLAILSV